MQALFVPSTEPLRVAVLSAQEMEETQGAVIPFAVGAGIGFMSYAGSLAHSSFMNSRAGRGTFAGNFANNWNTRQAVFSAGVGALSGGLANVALRNTGTIINYRNTLFLRSFHSPVRQATNNMARTWTTSRGLAIQGASFAGSQGAHRWHNRISHR
jgi:hypothetical protein